VPAVVARAEALPFRDGAFDTVLCGLVLCSVADPMAALREARRVLAPGGSVRALEHVRPPGVAGALADVAQPAWTALAGGCHPNRDTERAFGEAGFTVDPATRRARGLMLRLVARPGAAPAGSDRPMRKGPAG
jgi:ubiquinone/menaquinone biosynthesis C-methylase UbiE